MRPRLLVCGHVHEGRGAEVVSWDLGAKNVSFREEGVQRWRDEAVGERRRRLSIVDLTGRGRGKEALVFRNDGGMAEEAASGIGDARPGRSVRVRAEEKAQDRPRSMSPGYTRMKMSAASSPHDQADWQPKTPPQRHPPSSSHPQSYRPSASTSPLNDRSSPSLPPATRGKGGTPPSPRCDVEALAGRLGRRETCIVNAAIVANSYPFKEAGGRKFNQPIVVDLMLPVA